MANDQPRTYESLFSFANHDQTSHVRSPWSFNSFPEETEEDDTAVRLGRSPRPHINPRWRKKSPGRDKSLSSNLVFSNPQPASAPMASPVDRLAFSDASELNHPALHLKLLKPIAPTPLSELSELNPRFSPTPSPAPSHLTFSPAAISPASASPTPMSALSSPPATSPSPSSLSTNPLSASLSLNAMAPSMSAESLSASALSSLSPNALTPSLSATSLSSSMLPSALLLSTSSSPSLNSSSSSSSPSSLGSFSSSALSASSPSSTSSSASSLSSTSSNSVNASSTSALHTSPVRSPSTTQSSPSLNSPIDSPTGRRHASATFFVPADPVLPALPDTNGRLRSHSLPSEVEPALSPHPGSPSLHPAPPCSAAFSPVCACPSCVPHYAEHPFGEHPSRTLFVRNINSNVEEEELRALFSPFGEIRSIYSQCKHRGFVMISYYDIRHANKAMRALQGRVLRRRKLDIHYSIPKDNPPDKDLNQGTLVVFNLDPQTKNEDLQAIFGQYGQIKEIRETPNKKHHKFIEFYDVRHADEAMKHLNKTELRGKKIKIESSRPGGVRRARLVPSTAPPTHPSPHHLVHPNMPVSGPYPNHYPSSTYLTSYPSSMMPSYDPYSHPVNNLEMQQPLYIHSSLDMNPDISYTPYTHHFPPAYSSPVHHFPPY